MHHCHRGDWPGGRRLRAGTVEAEAPREDKEGGNQPRVEEHIGLRAYIQIDSVLQKSEMLNCLQLVTCVLANV